MLKIQSRIPFGPADDPRSQVPWPIPTNFSVEWLSKIFVPFQEGQLRQVTEQIADGTKRIEALRAEASNPAKKMVLGEKKPNGIIVRSAHEQRLQADIETHAKKQTVSQIIEIRNSLDKTVPPLIRTMHRASLAAQTLSARYFDKLSCMSRFSAGLGKLELAQLRANFATYVRGMAPIELARLAQNCIDDVTNPQMLVLIDVIRVENFGRKKDERAFENVQLLPLIPVAEYDQAQPLLQRVVDLYNQANILWQDFSGNANRATTLRIAGELGRMKLSEQTVQGD